MWPEVPFDDDMGHGTHTAGTVGSARFGVAKKCTIIDVKTARSVYSTAAKMIEALEWVGQNATGIEGRAAKSVVSMSLGELFHRLLSCYDPPRIFLRRLIRFFLFLKPCPLRRP